MRENTVKFKQFKAPIGIGALHREYDILCHLGGKSNLVNTEKDWDTQEKIDNDASYWVAIEDLLRTGLIEKDGDTYKLTILGKKVLGLCHEMEIPY